MRLILLTVLCSALAVGGGIALADVGGLSGEADVRVDGVLVRRVRDPHNGVVCYVASSYVYSVAPHGNTLAIACLKEQ